MNTLRVDIALYNKQMKLPGAKNAVVTPDKTTKYLLSATHASGRHKARFFAAFGFSADLAEQLASALIRHANEHEVTKIETSPFGTRYVIDGQIMSPDGRNPIIRSVWFVETNEIIPNFVTAYPL